MPVPSSFNDLDTVANNNSPPGTESAKGNVDDYLRQVFAFIRTLYNDKAALASPALTGAPTAPTATAGTDTTQVATTAFANAVVNSGARVMGLTGNVNAATPLIKFDLSASMVTLRNTAGATVTRYTTGTLTCDLGLAGSTANGRDQAGAFTANSWIHLYFIWNGTTLATIASTSATAPTLPSGYTHYCYATSIRWNASSNIIPMYARGAKTLYDLTNGSSVNRVVASGTATTMTAVNCAGLVPPNAVRGVFSFVLGAGLAGTGAVTMFYRMPGSAIVGMPVASIQIQVAGQSSLAINTLELALNASQQIEYMLSGAVGSGGGNIDVQGFVVPNGDV